MFLFPDRPIARPIFAKSIGLAFSLLVSSLIFPGAGFTSADEGASDSEPGNRIAVIEASNRGSHQQKNRGTRMLRDPDVSKTKIVFVHANDLWLVDRKGGDALRLTADEGSESDPVFSPDGKWIAFTAQYEGNTDVYCVSSSGGTPKRLTWHPGADVVQSWTPDGKIMFQSGREGEPTKLWRFYTVSREGGFPEPLALPQAYQGEMNADGKYIAYQEIGLWDPEWRNYRGGQAQPIAIVSTSTWDRVTTPWEGERHLAPVWLDGVVYYLSERDFASNVWSFNPKTKEHRQMTHHVDFDVKSLGTGDGKIVYEQAGYLFELDPKTADSKQLVINVARDLNYARPRWEEISDRSLRDARLSPTGKRALFESRGDLFTVPLDKGSWRNLTNSSAVADRHAVWSPDGSRIAWFNDAEGEYGLVIADQTGNIQKRIKLDEPTFYFVPTWSPDGKKLAFTDTDYRVLVLDLESEELTHADTDRFAHPERSMNPVWSPDSRWLAYSRRLENQLRAIFVYDVANNKAHQLTDGMADTISPVWDASGKYMYFLASTNYGLNTGWLDMTSYDRPVRRSLHIVALSEETPSPFLPQSDEEASGEDEETGKPKDSKNGDEKSTESDSNKDQDDEATTSNGGKGSESKKENGGSGKNDSKVDVVIDMENIVSRIMSAPGVSTGDFQGLVKAHPGHVFVLESVEGARGVTVKRYSVENQKLEEFATGVRTLAVSHDRKKVLMQTSSGWKHADSKGSGKSAKSLSLSGVRVKIDPKAEWKQMLREGWRYMRDFLYVENVHGAPWDEVWERYSPWLEDVNHRSDFNLLLDMLSGEVAVGHSYVRGGDMPELESPRTGLLGADLEVANDRYRITHVYKGDEWNAGTTGPLSHPGMKVQAGDYVLAINGRELTSNQNIFELLENTAGRTTALTVNSEPAIEGARHVIVVPASSERQLRTWEWVARNQKRVDELSDGRLAYVWLPNTGQGGYQYFNRMYFAQQDSQGAVIDERNNGGGSAADYIIEVLSRELTGYFNSRAGDKLPFTQPMAGLFGPKVMIINERSGSGGDLLPYLFRFKKLGPLVGTKTWGGLVGTWDTPPLIDGGRFVAPRGGFFDVDGKWAVEGEGVAPDIEVRNDPRAVIEGHDPQLERAVAEALELLKTQKVERKPEPAPPVRYRRPDRKK